MALSTGQIELCYPTGWPHVASTGEGVGFGITTGHYVNLSRTGCFATGSSNLVGSTTYTRYTKLFFRHGGAPGDTLTDPQLYITNETVTDQITMAPDAYYTHTSYYSHATGFSTGRAVMPNHLKSSDFSGYTASAPLNLSDLPRGQIILDSGGDIGFWLRLEVQPGLHIPREASFNIGIRGTLST